MCKPGDAIMADKGFLVSDVTTPKGVNLIIPPFKHKKRNYLKEKWIKLELSLTCAYMLSDRWKELKISTF